MLFARECDFRPQNLRASPQNSTSSAEFVNILFPHPAVDPKYHVYIFEPSEALAPFPCSFLLEVPGNS